MKLRVVRRAGWRAWWSWWRLRSRASGWRSSAGRLRERVDIGVLVVENLPTIVGRGGPVILGGEFLRHCAVTFDQPAHRTRIPPRSWPQPLPAHREQG